jgi:hypothetical protein
MNYYFQCPKCQSDSEFVKPSEEDSGLGCLLFIFGGFIPALLFAGHKHGRIQCRKCTHIFPQPSLPSSPLAKFAGWILALSLIPAVTSIFFFNIGDFASLLPVLPVISIIEEAVRDQPRVAAYLLGVLFVLIVIPCIVVACVSNARFRKHLANRYQVHPPAYSQFTQPDAHPSRESGKK